MPDRVRHLGRGSGSDLTPRRRQAGDGRQAAGVGRGVHPVPHEDGGEPLGLGSVGRARACAQPCCTQAWLMRARSRVACRDSGPAVPRPGRRARGGHMQGGQLPLAAASQASSAPGLRPRGPASQQAWLGWATLPATARGRGEGSVQAGYKREGGSQAF